MKYRDLVQFDPIETVIQIRTARKAKEAEKLVASYVISGEMAERLVSLVFPNIQFDEPADNKGLLIVGNYGTGKSHLMSVLSAIAEHADMVPLLRNEQVAQQASSIAGKFKVIRTELGSTTIDFREFICTEIQNALETWGISYTFPARDKISNHKGAFEEMMTKFHDLYPDHGLLILVDELLEYLRSRDDQKLILDLAFLRELGEISRDLRFRFIGGLQEMLFENQRFSFAADSIRRVKDRFEQVLIARRDVKFVVAERLLKKTAEQQVWIRKHLSQFAKFYGSMNERMDEFVHLFPVHPDYVDIFERITVIEKREVLKTLSLTMKRCLDDEVPTDTEEAPGLITYERYWKELKENAAFRSTPEIREVIDCSQTLEDRINRAFTQPAYRPMALRVIHGLSLHRLTIGDIYAPLGATPEELRDTLCLYDPFTAEMGGDPDADMLIQVETVLREISRTVSGQFISVNTDNRQYYLDLKKSEDFDAIIEKRAESLDERIINRYYFDILHQVMECSVTTLVSNFRIWQHELEWQERRVSRLGYLFFGQPNERSTAQPPRDFYIYFLPMHQIHPFKDEKLMDEVFFRLANPDDTFQKALKLYAAAGVLQGNASGLARNAYDKRAQKHLQTMVSWLREHLLHAFVVTYRGKKMSLFERVKGQPVTSKNSDDINVRDTINLAAALCLHDHFEAVTPDYPRFSVLITSNNRPQAAQDALRWMRGITQTRQAKAVLQALELLDGERLVPTRSKYANAILDMLKQKGVGKVINQDELIQEVTGIEYAMPESYRLEPEWLIVLLVALVYGGYIVLSVHGKKFDSNDIDILISKSLNDLLDFKHIELPKEWNVPALRALFELLDLPPGMAQSITQGNDQPVQEMHKAAKHLIHRLLFAQSIVQTGMPFWGQNLLTGEQQASYVEQLQRTKIFLESLQNMTTAGRMKNLRADESEVQSHTATLHVLQEIDVLQKHVNDLGPIASYLAQAELILSSNEASQQAWIAQLCETRHDSIGILENPTKRNEPSVAFHISQKLATLKREYINLYTQLHTQARLGAYDDERKTALHNDSRVKQLQRLATIDLMPVQQLINLQSKLAHLKSCFQLTTEEIEVQPVCPHCGFRPSLEPVPTSPVAEQLDDIAHSLDSMLDEWTTTLLNNLEDPTTQEHMSLLKPEETAIIEAFLQNRQLPATLEQEFLQPVQEILSGLTKVVVSMEDLRSALVSGGIPTTPTELQRRFEAHIRTLTKGIMPNKARIVVE